MVPLFNVLTMRGSVAQLDCKTVSIFAYSSAREQSDVWGKRTSRFATLNRFWEKKNPDCFAVYSRVVSESDSQFGGTRFESCFDHFLDLLSGRSEFKSSATSVNNQLVASCQMGFCYVLFELFISKYLSGVPVKLVGYTKRTFRYKQIIIYQISLSE